MFVVALLGKWWIEVAAFCAPPMALVVALRAPAVQVTEVGGLSITNVAAVQGAVTGLSLIALVLAVEMARRQEDRDDAVYDIMLRSAGIRPTFVFALVALLTTLAGMGLSDFSHVPGESSLYPKLLLGAYVLIAATGLALLVTTLRTIGALKPTAIIDYRFKANDRERRRKVAEFISYALDEVPRLDPFERLVLPHRPVGLTAAERVFAEIDDALQGQQATRFAGALERLRALTERSADQIRQSALPMQAAGEPQYGYWFPLDAIKERLPELWRTAYERSGREYAREMWSLQYWLVTTGIERGSGQMLEVGLRSGLISYHAVDHRRAALGEHARREWMNLTTGAWGCLRAADLDCTDGEKLAIAERLIEHLQEYSSMLLVNDDVSSFEAMLAEFHDTAKRLNESWIYFQHHSRADIPPGLDVHQYVLLALLALIGRALLLETLGRIADATPYVDRLHELVRDGAQIQRFAPQVFQHERALQRQWSWWEMDTNEEANEALRIMPEQYPMIGLLYCLYSERSTQALPSLDGYAQRFIDVWNAHANIILKTAGVDADDRDDALRQIVARLQAAVEAEHRERDDRTIGALIDPVRVNDFMSGLREQRERDRVLEHRFEQVGRLRRIDGVAWSGRPFGHRWLLPREPFTTGTKFEPLELPGAGLAFERGLFVELDRLVGNARTSPAVVSHDVDDLLSAIDNGLIELAADYPLIVLHGTWPNEVIGELWMRSDRRGGLLSFGGSAFRQERVSYRGHWIAQSGANGDPVLLMVNLNRWGWLIRTPLNGEDFALDLEEIDRDEAGKLADRTTGDERDREQRVREFMLKVRLTAQEHTRFEVENPDAALRIPVRADGEA